MRRALAVFLLGWAVAGCGSDDGVEDDIADRLARGTIRGQDATVSGGRQDVILSDEETLVATLHLGPYDGCNDSNVPGGRLLLDIPAAPGLYELGDDRGVNFVAESDDENLVATEGVLRVDEVTEAHLSGGLRAYFDDANQVDGTFTIDICAD